MCHGISNHISYHTLVTCPVTYLWRIYHLIRVYCWEGPDLCWANGMLVSTSVDTPPPTAKKSSSRAWNKNIDILQKTTPEFRAERLLLIKLSLDITPLRWTQTRSCRSIRSLHLNRDWTRYPFWNWTQYCITQRDTQPLNGPKPCPHPLLSQPSPDNKTLPQFQMHFCRFKFIFKHSITIQGLLGPRKIYISQVGLQSQGIT